LESVIPIPPDSESHSSSRITKNRQVVAKVAPVKETVVATDEGAAKMTKSAKRRMREKAKKATGKETSAAKPAVSLNSQAPAMTGASTTSGLKQPLSLTSQKRSEGVASHSQEQGREKRQLGGEKPRRSDQNTQSTHGHPEELKPRKGVSSCSATST